MLQRPAADARLGAAVPPLRPRVRRHAAPGARPRVPRRLRARPRRARVSAAARARIRCCSTRRRSALGGVARHATPSATARRAPAAEDRDRRRERAAVSVVSAPGRRRDAAARAVVLRARRDARDHRPRARSPPARARSRPTKAARASRGRRRAIRRARSTTSSTTWRSLKPLLESRDRAVGEGTRALPARPERRAAALGHQPLGARTQARWSPSDGLIRVAPAIAPALEQPAPGNRRPYSLSALQRFCDVSVPVPARDDHRLEPWDEPEPLVRLDPLTRGSLFHRAQAEFYRARRRRRRAAGDDRARCRRRREPSTRSSTAWRREYADELAPAIERVWRDEIDEIRRDLGIWVRRLADGGDWIPQYFEFSFGLHDDGRDPRSLPDPVLVDGRFVLRGSVDLIERHRELPTCCASPITRRARTGRTRI